MDNHLVLHQMYLNIAKYTFVSKLQHFLTAEIAIIFFVPGSVIRNFQLKLSSRFYIGSPSPSRYWID